MCPYCGKNNHWIDSCPAFTADANRPAKEFVLTGSVSLFRAMEESIRQQVKINTMEQKKEFNANQFRSVYKELDINIDKLGCVMLDVDGSPIKPYPDKSIMYTSQNPDRFWIDGFVAESTPHVTLLYGLLQSANTEYRAYVDQVLKGWSCNSVVVDRVGFFESPYADDPYFCIVAHLVITDALKEANQRIQLLPHINTYPEYKAHISIAYVKNDDLVRDEVVAFYEKALSGLALNVTGLNYGK